MMIESSKSKKNSLIELMRFFFSVWVLYYHGYIPHRINGFNDGFLAVEFFFVLSGFYLVRSIDKYTSLPLKEGLIGFLNHRFSAIAILFIINEVFCVYYVVYHNAYLTSDIFGYLWYIRELFLVMTIIFILRKHTANNRKFYLIISTLPVITIIIFGIFPSITHVGTLRALLAMPLGMLIAIIPKLSSKNNDGSLQKLRLFAAVVGVIISILICLQIAYMPKTKHIQYFLKLIVFPAMIYFASCIQFNVKFFNWLGSLSFPIYSFQCIVRVLETHGLINVNHQFAIIVTMVLIYSLIENIIRLKRKKLTI